MLDSAPVSAGNHCYCRVLVRLGCQLCPEGAERRFERVGGSQAEVCFQDATILVNHLLSSRIAAQESRDKVASFSR